MNQYELFQNLFLREFYISKRNKIRYSDSRDKCYTFTLNDIRSSATKGGFGIEGWEEKFLRITLLPYLEVRGWITMIKNDTWRFTYKTITMFKLMDKKNIWF